ncbi:transglutaminase domain-containing protein [Ferruginibacter sp. HRS2-29]|uniref:transglutaminase domain-containing protein n=1 Tax=Ferruginibacter sp. HRS2-29 TaxID=2487334 RepID=UPI0020CDF2B3|nr:transglutaminase domain-containing protein [Ferruginibacter sp. HRS2-29]MCP9749831.1 hypothetical protein [Ferruginibacter sp. HRS2-29]
MKTALLLFLLTACRFAGAQELNIPYDSTFSSTTIAKYVVDNFRSEEARFRAIHTWTATHIQYSRDSMYLINFNPDPAMKVTAALKRRKGVCENFAAVFTDIAQKSGLTAYVVNGYTRQGGRVDRTGHSWCAVSLSGQWYFCDPTWDKDNFPATRYFLVTPAEFIQTHIPFDPLWQLSNEPVSHKDFINGSYSSRQPGIPYNFKDSLAAYLQLNELQQLRSGIARIEKAGVLNDMTRNDLAFLKMNSEMIREEEDSDNYNDIVNNLNKATVQLNAFITYRNAQFSPAKTDSEMRAQLNTAKKLLGVAQQKIDSLAKSEAKVQHDTDVLREQLERVNNKLSSQETFLDKFLSATPEERLALLYK